MALKKIPSPGQRHPTEKNRPRLQHRQRGKSGEFC